jgi:hypothetical protein
VVRQESKDVGDIYFLGHPDFGTDLQKITEDANKRLPLIWWHDLYADVKTAENAFKDKVVKLSDTSNGVGEKLVARKKSLFQCVVS